MNGYADQLQASEITVDKHEKNNRSFETKYRELQLKYEMAQQKLESVKQKNQLLQQENKKVLQFSAKLHHDRKQTLNSLKITRETIAWLMDERY